jgi:superfamily II DNA or RNA helicase
MITPLRVTNTLCSFPRTAPSDFIRRLDSLTAFKVEGAQFVKAFKTGFWDGREHLVKLNRRTGLYEFPTGLLDELMKSPPLAEAVKLVDERRRPREHRELQWIGYEPRDYQLETEEIVLADRGIMTGRGILHLPIRAGKTLITARLFVRLGLRALFIVPSDLLLLQSAKAFREFIAGTPIGLVGAGSWDPQYITVATVQTLLARPQAAAALLANIDALVQDEAHHLEAPEWRKPVLFSDAYWKLGLSATLFLNRENPSEASSIWLRAATGPILHKVSMKRLIEAGHLVPPDIYVYPVTKPTDYSSKMSYRRAYEDLIVTSEYRNAAIADLAEQAVRAGLRVLVDTGRLKQLTRLVEMLRARGVKVEAVSGKTPPNKRVEIISAFRRREVHVIVGTVLGEGVDIPELEVVINAEAMKSKTAVIQRMRNLTECQGKTKAVMIDFWDKTHAVLEKHSTARTAMYRGIRGFTVHDGPMLGGRFVFVAGGATAAVA